MAEDGPVECTVAFRSKAKNKADAQTSSPSWSTPEINANLARGWGRLPSNSQVSGAGRPDFEDRLSDSREYEGRHCAVLRSRHDEGNGRRGHEGACSSSFSDPSQARRDTSRASKRRASVSTRSKSTAPAPCGVRRTPSTFDEARSMSHSVTWRTRSARRLPAAQHRHGHVSTPRRHQQRAALLFLLPGCALFCHLCVIYPIISSISLSFYHWDGMTPKTFVGFDNYVELFHARYLLYGAEEQRHLARAISAGPADRACCRALSESGTCRGIRVVKSLFFAPFVLSGVVVGLMF